MVLQQGAATDDSFGQRWPRGNRLTGEGTSAVERELVAGDKRVGLLLHSYADEASVTAGVAWLDQNRGFRVELPYLAFVDQFNDPSSWFDDRDLPANLIFRSEKYNAALFGCSVSRIVSAGRISVGGILAREAILYERESHVDAPLTVSTFHSVVDGLAEWTDLKSVEWDTKDVAGPRGTVRQVHYEVQQRDSITWYQGEAKMMIRTEWGSEQDDPRPGIHLNDEVVVVSKFRTARPIADHLREHAKLRAFLAINFGAKVYFRKHRVRDQLFPFSTMDGKAHGAERHRAYLSETVSEHFRPEPKKNTFTWPILSVRDITDADLTRWAARFDGFSRTILPIAALFRREVNSTEERVINSSMAVEALGQELPVEIGEEATYSKSRRLTTATYFFRVIRFSGIDFAPISPTESALAWALANTYNRVKHADRGDFPNPTHSYFAGELALLAMRVSLMKRLATGTTPIERYNASWGVGQLFEHMRQNHIRVYVPDDSVRHSGFLLG